MAIPQKGDVIEVTVERVMAFDPDYTLVTVSHEDTVTDVTFWWKTQQPSIPLPFEDDPGPEEVEA